MPTPVAAPTNKLWTIIPNALLRARFLYTLYDWSIGSINVFLGTFSRVTIVIKFCHIQPVGLQIHHSHLRRTVPSRQSVCHHPLMHAAHLNQRIQMRSESNEADYNLLCSPRTLIETWAFSMSSIRGTLDVATWRKFSASYALGASSISTKHYTRAHPYHFFV